MQPRPLVPGRQAVFRKRVHRMILAKRGRSPLAATTTPSMYRSPKVNVPFSLESRDARVPRDGTGAFPPGAPRGRDARRPAPADPPGHHGLEHRAPAQERRRRRHLVRPGRDRTGPARKARPACRQPLLGGRCPQVRLRAAAPRAAHRRVRRGVPPLRLAPRHALERPRTRRPPAARAPPGRRHRGTQPGWARRARGARAQGRRAHQRASSSSARPTRARLSRFKRCAAPTRSSAAWRRSTSSTAPTSWRES